MILDFLFGDTQNRYGIINPRPTETEQENSSGGSVVEIPCFHCRGHTLDPDQEDFTCCMGALVSIITIYKKFKKNTGSRAGEFSAPTWPWPPSPGQALLPLSPGPIFCSSSLPFPWHLPAGLASGWAGPGLGRPEQPLVPSLHRVASLRKLTWK